MRFVIAATVPIAAPTDSSRFLEGGAKGITQPALPRAHPKRGGVRSPNR